MSYICVVSTQNSLKLYVAQTSESDWKKYRMKKETQSLTVAAQFQALKINSLKNYHGKKISAKSSVCGIGDETVAHIVEESPILWCFRENIRKGDMKT